MLITLGKSVWDTDLDMLAELLAVIDAQLETVLQRCDDPSLAGQLGYFDSAEHITGLGFVACQAYLTAIYGSLNVKKLNALSIGPHHSSGQTTVEIINHAANFWKHHDEWHLDKSGACQDRVRKAFDAVGFPVDLDYPLVGILSELVVPESAAFKSLVGKLRQWREEMRHVATKIEVGSQK